MTVTVFQVPLQNPRKSLVTKQTGVVTSSLINTAIPAGRAAIIIDEAVINLALIKSNLVYVAAEQCGNVIIEHSKQYTAQAALQCAYARVKHLTPKLNASFAVVDPAVITLANILTAGYDVAFLVNSPNVARRTTGLADVANEILSDYLRESLP